jgi:hypothetical protein
MVPSMIGRRAAAGERRGPTEIGDRPRSHGKAKPEGRQGRLIFLGIED